MGSYTNTNGIIIFAKARLVTLKLCLPFVIYLFENFSYKERNKGLPFNKVEKKLF